MPQALLQLEGIVLSKDLSGENFQKFDIFSPIEGKICCLNRISKKLKNTQLDLFDKVDIELSQASQGNLFFIKEYTTTHRHFNISKSYTALTYASHWSKMLLRNLSHIDHLEPIYDLTLKALTAWETLPFPEATYYKSLYLLAKHEGLPISQDWLQSLPTNLKEPAKIILNSPIKDLDPKALSITPLLHSLEDWLTSHSYIL